MALLPLNAALPADTNRWIPLAERMTIERSGACSVVLPNGGVLIIGGVSSNATLSSTELFEEGRFRLAAAMKSARSEHGCVLLRDGTVLVAGGRTTDGVTNEVEIYDPATNAWNSGPAMQRTRAGASVSVLDDGRVLIAGGEANGTVCDSLEIFDPLANRFVEVDARLSSPRKQHAAAVLDDGRVLIAGGSNGTTALDTVDLFAPQTGQMSPLGKMSVPRARLTATKLPGGRVVLLGGTDGNAEIGVAEIFDPETGIFAAGSSMAVARQGHAAILIPDNNTVLIVGGQAAGQALARTEIYVPWRQTFQSTGDLAVERTASAAVPLLGGGTILLAGGSTGAGAQSMVETLTAPTIILSGSTNLPGQAVPFTGAGWAPGEPVGIGMSDSALTDPAPAFWTEPHVDGTITDSFFAPVSEDVGRTFYLTATQRSLTAQVALQSAVSEPTLAAPRNAAAQSATASLHLSSVSPTLVYPTSVNMTLTGQGFDLWATSQVYFNNTWQDLGTVISPNVVDPLSSQLVVRWNFTGFSPGTYQIRILSRLTGQVSNAVSFAVASTTLQLSSVAPTTVYPQIVTLTLTGQGFDLQATSQVYFNNTWQDLGTVLSPNVVDTLSTKLVVQWNFAGFAPGTYQIRVLNRLSMRTSNAVNFVISNPTLQLSSVSPTSVYPAIVTLTLSGQGFDLRATSQVYFNNTWQDLGTVLSPNVVNPLSTQLTVQWNFTGFSPGTYQIRVLNRLSMQTSNAVNFVIAGPALQLSSVSPGSVYPQIVTLTLTGQGFDQRATSQVYFNNTWQDLGTVISPNVVNPLSTQLTVQWNFAGFSPGTYQIRVLNRLSMQTSNAVNFVIAGPALQLSNVSPGSVYPQIATLTLSGQGFDLRATSQVYFNNTWQDLGTVISSNVVNPLSTQLVVQWNFTGFSPATYQIRILNRLSMQTSNAVTFVIAGANVATYGISGQVTSSGAGLNGVTMSLSGPTNIAVSTNASGSYSVTSVPAGGNYALTPSLPSYSFTPVSQTFNNLGANQIANFTATATTATNLALGKVATQSSTLTGYGPAGASNAVDGNTDGNFFNKSVTHTNQESNPSWSVDLSLSAWITSIKIWNRTDCCADRLSDYWVFVSDSVFSPTDTPSTLQGRAGTWSSHQTTFPNPSTTIAVNAQGRYVRVQLSGSNYLSLAEVQVFGSFGTPAGYSIAGQVTLSGAGLSGVSMTLSSSQTISTSTNGSGNYSFSSVPTAGYVLTPSLTGFSFSPPSQTFNNLSGNQIANFTATAVATTNLALGKPATQSSTLTGYGPAGASNAVDGNTDGNFFHSSVTHTNQEGNPWWGVDLGVSTSIGTIKIWNRTDCCADRLSDYWVFISDTPFGPADTPTTLQGRAGTWSNHQTTFPNPSTTITANAQGRYVRVQLSGTNYLSLTEVQVFGH